MAQPINGCKVADLDAEELRTGGVSKPKLEAGLVDEFKTDELQSHGRLKNYPGTLIPGGDVAGFAGEVVAGFAGEVVGTGNDGVDDDDDG
ncbi:hypothetical protein NC651_012206 [Populus alba x Populus x berolinensis]|nr:hypothetical protein NC651_012206 [Populus alba x Populus x berolinensis]